MMLDLDQKKIDIARCKAAAKTPDPRGSGGLVRH